MSDESMRIADCFIPRMNFQIQNSNRKLNIENPGHETVDPTEQCGNSLFQIKYLIFELGAGTISTKIFPCITISISKPLGESEEHTKNELVNLGLSFRSVALLFTRSSLLCV